MQYTLGEWWKSEFLSCRNQSKNNGILHQWIFPIYDQGRELTDKEDFFLIFLDKNHLSHFPKKDPTPSSPLFLKALYFICTSMKSDHPLILYRNILLIFLFLFLINTFKSVKYFYSYSLLKILKFPPLSIGCLRTKHLSVQE